MVDTAATTTATNLKPLLPLKLPPLCYRHHHDRRFGHSHCCFLLIVLCPHRCHCHCHHRRHASAAAACHRCFGHHPSSKFVTMIFVILSVAAIAVIVGVAPVVIVDEDTMPGLHCSLCCRASLSLSSHCFHHHHCCQSLQRPAAAAFAGNVASFPCEAAMVMNNCRD